MSSPIPTRSIPPFVRSVDSSFPHTAVPRPPDVLPSSRWVSYMRSSGAPNRHLSSAQRALADSVWKEYDEKRNRAADEESLLSGSKASRHARAEAFLVRVQLNLMRSSFTPLFFRIFIIITSAIALALASDIYGNSRGCRDTSTHILAIIVNTIAIPYTLYIAWDEFFSRPIGLRRSRSKLRLLSLDLIFIIFDSANLSLAFGAGTNRDSDFRQPDQKCREQWGLSSVLLIALLAWVSTFSLSLFRLVYKLEGDVR